MPTAATITGNTEGPRRYERPTPWANPGKGLTMIDSTRPQVVEGNQLPPHHNVAYAYRNATTGRQDAPCPICGRRTATLSWGDTTWSTIVQIYCTNETCPAREIDIHVRRGALNGPLTWE